MRRLRVEKKLLELTNEELQREVDRRREDKARRVREGREAWDVFVAVRDNQENEARNSGRKAKKMRRKSI